VTNAPPDDDEDDDLTLEFDSEASGRSAVIADEGDSIWLYLTHPTRAEFERDCWLFNTPKAPDDPELERYEQQSVPPPAPARFINEGGVRPTPSEKSISVRWSADGNAVAVLVDGSPVGLASMSAECGMSRYLRESCPWGEPWDDARWVELLGA